MMFALFSPRPPPCVHQKNCLFHFSKYLEQGVYITQYTKNIDNFSSNVYILNRQILSFHMT